MKRTFSRLLLGMLFLGIGLVASFVLWPSLAKKRPSENPPQPEAVTSKADRPSEAAKPNNSNSGETPPPVSELDQRIQALSNDAVVRTTQIEKLIAEMPVAERLKALQQLWSEDTTGARREIAGELLRKWSQESPQAAAEWVSQRLPGPLQHEGARSVAISWASQNLTEAANWVRGWPENEKESGLLAVAFEATRTSPKDALWLASELQPTSSRDALITHAAREWATRDPAAPVSWAEKMESSSLREQVFASAALSLSETDPAAAATIALQKIEPGGRQDDTIVSVVQRWAQNDPAQAAEWVAKFPEGRMGTAAIENLIQIWADKTPQKPAEWLTDLPEGPLRDAGVAAYAHKLAITQPQSALEWAAKVSQAEVRDQLIESLAQMWLQSDRKAATAWMQASSISDDAKARILKTP